MEDAKGELLNAVVRYVISEMDFLRPGNTITSDEVRSDLIAIFSFYDIVKREDTDETT